MLRVFFTVLGICVTTGGELKNSKVRRLVCSIKTFIYILV